jgi:hypothetical protein
MWNNILIGLAIIAVLCIFVPPVVKLLSKKNSSSREAQLIQENMLLQEKIAGLKDSIVTIKDTIIINKTIYREKIKYVDRDTNDELQQFLAEYKYQP